MMSFDWTGLLLGVLAGVTLGALFFAGLAWGMKNALRRHHPMTILLPSAILRIGGLLAGGWVVAAWLGIAGGLGFALGFLALRTIVLARVRAGLAKEAA